jgi:hypothetical protein
MGKIQRIYDITRNGSTIGTHTMAIEREGERAAVTFATRISVRVMMVEAYRFASDSHETWDGDQFLSFKSQTNDNGKKRAVSVTSSDTGTRFDIDGKSRDVPQKIRPGTVWNKDLLASGQSFDDSTGKLLKIDVTDLGDEILNPRGVKRQARHYRIGGDIANDLWFADDVLLRRCVVAPDRSKIFFDLRA